MPELRKDPITGRWVIISTERGKRPNEFLRESVIAANGKNCPFCPGSEAKTPTEILVYGRNGGGVEHARAGAFASSRTSFPRWASKAISIAKAKACSTR